MAKLLSNFRCRLGPAGDDIEYPRRPPSTLKEFRKRKRTMWCLGRGLQTTVFPAAIAEPTLQVTIASGEFHGVMAATTP